MQIIRLLCRKITCLILFVDLSLHRESDKDSCNLLTDHIKQNVKLNKKGMLINFSITVWKYRFSVTVSLGNLELR